MDNVAVLVEDRAEGRPLFGLYEGIPLTKRGPTSYGWAMPDRITLYQDAICGVSATEAEVVAQIRKTVIHEVATTSASVIPGSTNSVGPDPSESCAIRVFCDVRRLQGAIIDVDTQPWTLAHQPATVRIATVFSAA